MSKKKKDSNGALDMTMFTSAEDAVAARRSRTMVPVSPNLDAKLGGGILEGSLVLVQTWPKVGKTLLAMQIVRNALKQGRYVVYADVECRLDEIKYGVDKIQEQYGEKFMLLKSSKETGVLSGNQIYEQIYKMTMIPKYYGTLYVIDSISHATPKSSLEDSEVKADRRDQNAKLNSDFCKKVGNYLRVSDSIVIGIQHLTVVQNPTYTSVEADGGNKLQYEADIVLKATHKPKNLAGENLDKGTHDHDGYSGQRIDWNIPFNKILKPYISKEDPCRNYLLFNGGCWWAREALDILIEMGLVAVGGGGWHTFMTADITGKAQGEVKATAMIEDNREYFEKLIAQYFTDTFGAKYDFRNTHNE